MKRKKDSDNEIRICFVAPTTATIGGIFSWFNLVKSAIPTNYIVSTIDTTVKKFFKNNKIIKTINSLILLHKQKKQLKNVTNRIDILHLATSGGYGFFRDYQLAKIAKKHNIITILHLHFGSLPELLSRHKGLLFRLFCKCMKLIDYIVAIDETTFDCLRYNGYQNSFLIPNPVIAESNIYNSKNRKIIYIGHVVKTKGVEELVEAFKKVNNNDWSLDIVGPIRKKYETKLIKMVGDCNKIHLLGPVSHKIALEFLKESAFLILPSYSEGMPNVILEAMAFGIPCIATKVGNIPNMIRDCGMLIEKKTIEPLVSAINTLCDDEELRISLSQKSFMKAKKEYSIDVVMDKLNELWRNAYEQTKY